MIGDKSDGCSLHRVHAPQALTVEQHHVIPVAWQLAWQPAVAPFPGPDTEGRGMLWDDRTVACCPTGHRNVHHIIVQMMKALAAAGSDDPLDARKAVPGRGAQYETAYLALCRFREVNGSLKRLTELHLWGVS